MFATPDKAYASCFLVPTDDSWVKIGRYSNDGIHGPWNAVISNEGRFKQADSGGVIYHLPIQSFAFHPERNMGNIEWTSTLPVKPVDKEHYESGLSAMRKAGVNVYFVDWAIFDAIKQSNDHGKSIIDSLSPDYRTQ